MSSTRIANPGPLGLLGFGMTTILLNVHNAGFFPMASVILSMGIFYGGIAQIIAGIFEFKKGNTFGATAFTSYGFFWISLVGIMVMPSMGFGVETSHEFLAVYLALWGIFSFFMFIATLKANIALRAVFFLLVILFALLVIGNATGNAAMLKFAGYEGMLCGAVAFYLAMAEVLNEQYGRTILPIGERHA